MNADLLRRAAQAMRERAEAATPGPWTYDGNPSGAVWPLPYPATLAYVQPRRDELPVAYAIPNGDVIPTGTQVANAEHIASWHPAVALAVADWLDDEAVVAGEDKPNPWALEVARVFLGGAS